MTRALNPESPAMRALVQPRYGRALEVLRVEEAPRPTPLPGEVLVRVRAASVCRGDIFLLHGRPYVMRLGFGLRRPGRIIAGQDLAGEVAQLGEGVTELAVGDAVYGQRFGAFAEYVCVPSALLAKKPPALSFEEAAAVPDSGVTALEGLTRAGGLRAGQRLLIYGASGGVGTSAVQIGKALGAEVTAVASARHAEKLLALGADRVLDRAERELCHGGARYDVIFDLGGERSLEEMRRAMAEGGVFVDCAGGAGGPVLGPLPWMMKVALTSLVTRRKMTSFMARPGREPLEVLSRMIEAGSLRPVIEHVFPFEEGARAVAHVESGHAQGKTVIAI